MLLCTDGERIEEVNCGSIVDQNGGTGADLERPELHSCNLEIDEGLRKLQHIPKCDCSTMNLSYTNAEAYTCTNKRHGGQCHNNNLREGSSKSGDLFGKEQTKSQSKRKYQKEERDWWGTPCADYTITSHTRQDLKWNLQGK
jgi:hypothetical protein